MPRFIFASFLVLSLFLYLWLRLINNTEPGQVLVSFLFSLLTFINLTIITAIFLYVVRTAGKNRLKKWLERPIQSLETNEERILYRRCLKMAALISAFVSLLLFLRIIELFTLFNFSLLLAMIVIGAVYLYLRARG